MKIRSNTTKAIRKLPRLGRKKSRKRARNRALRTTHIEDSDKTIDSAGLKNSIGKILQAKDGKLGEELGEVSDLKRVNETEMYAAYVHHKLSKSNPDLAEEFLTKVQEQTGIYKEERGDHLFYKASDRVMRSFVRSKQIKKRDYKQLKYEAFGKSQFDSDRTRISAKRLEDLPSGDTAVRAIKTALTKAESNEKASDPEFQVWRAHEAKISRQKYREKKRAGLLGKKTSEPIGDVKNLRGIPDGFLWKPSSDGDGKLVILLPKEWTGKAEQVKILDPSGKKVVETGRFTSIANGFRQHYRFNKSGGSYPDNATVQVTFSDGSVASIKIGDSANRNE